MFRKFKWLLLSTLTIIADQSTKWLAAKHLSMQEPMPIWPGFFDLRLAHNTGAAFGFLGKAGGWQRGFFIGFTVAMSIFLLGWLFCLPRYAKMKAGAIALILGGAVGNVVDRIRLGYVVDFLDFYYKNLHWPTFNMADIAIVIGVLLLLLKSTNR